MQLVIYNNSSSGFWEIIGTYEDTADVAFLETIYLYTADFDIAYVDETKVSVNLVASTRTEIMPNPETGEDVTVEVPIPNVATNDPRYDYYAIDNANLADIKIWKQKQLKARVDRLMNKYYPASKQANIRREGPKTSGGNYDATDLSTMETWLDDLSSNLSTAFTAIAAAADEVTVIDLVGSTIVETVPAGWSADDV